MKVMKAMLAAAALVAASGASVAQDKVIFALNWIPAGNHYGVFAAKEQGFYKDAGLDVDIQRGYGSGDTAKRIATGQAHIGISDATSVIVGRSEGLKVKQVASIFARSADAIFYVEDRGIAEPKDLEGHTLGGSTGETTLNLLPVFGERANVDVDKVEIVNIAPSAKFASLVAGSVDAIVGFVNEEPAIQSAAQKAGVKVSKFVFADYGVDYYSIGLIANDEAIETQGDLIRRLVEATMRGYAWALENREAAADAFVKNHPESSREVSLEQWDVARQLMITDSIREHGLGYIDAEKMVQTLELVKSFKDVGDSIQADDLYTMEFLPEIPVK